MKTLPIVCFVILLSGCELLNTAETTIPAPSTVLNQVKATHFNYRQYYVWLKTLDKKQLIDEISAQKLQLKKATVTKVENDKLLSNTQLIADLKLALLYSLPNSPIQNAYTAKSILNKYPQAFSDTSNNKVFNQENSAFFTIIKDLLNQQLFVFRDFTTTQNEQNKTIDTLSAQVEQLKMQITQLKNIETVINEREQ